MGDFATRFFRGFRSKLLWPVVGIMVLLVAAIAWIVNGRVQSEFRSDATRTLETASAVFENLQDVRNRNLLQRFKSLPNEPRYKAGLATMHEPTLRSLLADLVREQGVDVAVISSSNNRLVAQHKGISDLSLPAFLDASSNLTAVAIQDFEGADDTIQVGQRLFDVISVPIIDNSGNPIGALTIGTEIGESVAREFALLTHSQVLLFAGDALIASTLARRDVQSHLRALRSSTTTPVELGGEHYYASAGQFKTRLGKGGLGYVLLSSYEQPLQALRSTQQDILLVSVICIILGTTVAWYFIRRVAEPLEQLHDSVEAVAAGDFSRRVEVHSNDECGDLAVVFNRMVENLNKSRSELEDTLATLKTTQAQLIQSAKLSGIGEFVAGVAHELNNPLAVVMGYSELLQLRKHEAKTGEQITLIHKNAQRCHKIVQSLLSFARRHQPERKSTHLNALVEASTEFLQYQMRTSNVDVRLDLNPQLPAALIDPHQIQQVLVNLLNNARQAIEEHQPSGWIRISTSFSGNWVRVIVQDSGPGISPAHLEKIFDPFFTTKEVGKGTGLGLSMCYGIIKEHEGNIAVQSRPGLGATFIIELPMTSASPAANALSTSVAIPIKPEQGRGHRVLLVDDEVAFLGMMTEILECGGFEVDTAPDGATALERLQNQSYDATLCDWRMPGMGGRELHDRLQKIDPHKANRLIFVTGDVANPSTSQYLTEQGRKSIAKPFTLDEFRSVFDSLLKDSRS